MKFLCPQCLKIADIEPTSPEHEIVSVYCLHAGTRIGGGSEPVRMEPVTDPVPTSSEPASPCRFLNDSHARVPAVPRHRLVSFAPHVTHSEEVSMSRTLTALCCAALVSLVLAPLASAQNDQTAAPANNSIILLQTVTHTADGVHYRTTGYGTAFLVDPTGLALTNSHVVYTVQHDPAHYWLLAIVGHEFYGARIVCASRLPDDPTKPHAGGLTLSRDVAEIALTEPTYPFKTWGVHIKGTFSVLARRHDGPLPTFPSLALGPAPREGEAITVTGYSRLGPIPELYTLSGQVDRTDTLRTDGTPVFTMTFTSPPRPGGSGSPVLDAQGRVIGIFTWYDKYRSDVTIAQSAPALAPACR